MSQGNDKTRQTGVFYGFLTYIIVKAIRGFYYILTGVAMLRPIWCHFNSLAELPNGRIYRTEHLNIENFPLSTLKPCTGDFHTLFVIIQ